MNCKRAVDRLGSKSGLRQLRSRLPGIQRSESTDRWETEQHERDPDVRSLIFPCSKSIVDSRAVHHGQQVFVENWTVEFIA